MRLLDVSHTVESGMLTYKGLPAPHVCDYLSREASRKLYSPGTEFQIGRIEMVANTGTYVDSPFHRYAGGKDLSELPLASLANLDFLIARIDPAGGRAIDDLPFAAVDVRGKAVLVHTGWARHWRTEHYFDGFPYLTGRLAQWLRDAGAGRKILRRPGEGQGIWNIPRARVRGRRELTRHARRRGDGAYLRCGSVVRRSFPLLASLRDGGHADEA